MFPVINHIDDVLPHIEGDESFVVIDKGDYTLIDYVLEMSSTFPPLKDSLSAAIRRECRGICFDKSGKIIRRPFNKFFNVGQKEETLVQNMDWSIPHTVMDKRDGSMISAVHIGDSFIYGTRKAARDFVPMVRTFVDSKPDIRYDDGSDKSTSNVSTQGTEKFEAIFSSSD